MRHPTSSERRQASVDIYDLLQEAIQGALTDAGMKLSDIDGLGVICFQMSPDHAADLSWRMGMSVRWLIERSAFRAARPTIDGRID